MGLSFFIVVRNIVAHSMNEITYRWMTVNLSAIVYRRREPIEILVFRINSAVVFGDELGMHAMRRLPSKSQEVGYYCPCSW